MLAQDIYQAYFGLDNTGIATGGIERWWRWADDAIADKTKINQNQGQADNNCLTKYVS